MTSERIIFEAGNTTFYTLCQLIVGAECITMRDIPKLSSFKNFMGLHSLLYLLSAPCFGTNSAP
jgi:hypothetical protein